LREGPCKLIEIALQTEEAESPLGSGSAYIQQAIAVNRKFRAKRKGQMPKRSDIRKILVLGAGPITIGQACEFDYSGTQACKALAEEGYEVVLINSNPATIMTDPEIAQRTYLEPVTPQIAREVIARERPDALLPTMGGQTALNVAKELAETGVLDEFNVEMIGAKLDAINLAEDRELFKQKMLEIGLFVPKSGIARKIGDVRDIATEIGFPIIIRPAFTLGGTGGGIAYNQEELDAIASEGLNASPVHEILLEQSVLGWKEFELDCLRHRKLRPHGHPHGRLNHSCACADVE
jgi:carbamoyl-phosphate synthase large subunit